MKPGDNTAYTLSPIARIGRKFSDFSPYVPAINDAGIVAFQATLANGRSGVYVGDAHGVRPAVEPADGRIREVLSHPDISRDGAICFYALDSAGLRGVFLVRGGITTQIADSCGPLGPTMNPGGQAAFRAFDPSGNETIYSTRADGCVTRIAAIGDEFSGFHGLPCIGEDGRVLFRADRRDGVAGIYISAGEGVTAVVECGEEFRALNLFPSVDDAGRVLFCATRRDGDNGLYISDSRRVWRWIDTSAGFESFRTALPGASGPVFIATPAGEAMGIFTGRDPRRDRLLAIGETLFDATVEDFALNPVSINAAGSLAIRVRLSDKRQYILRADPAG